MLLVFDFKVDYRLKIFKGISVECLLMMRMKRKKALLYVIGVRDNPISTSINMIDINYKFYGFSGDLTETTY